MRYLILSMLLGCGLLLNAQTAELDVVTLKSGAMYKGVIAEYIPDESVTIKLVDGRTKTFAAEEIESITSTGGTATKEAPEKEIRLKRDGFFHTSMIGFQLGRSNSYNNVSFFYNTVNGYKFQNHEIGLGTGVETFLENLFIPLYGSYTYSLWDEPFTPFATADLGYAFNPAYEDVEDDYYGSNRYEGGLMAGLKFGFKAYTNRHFALMFSAGYRYYALQGEYVQYVWWPTESSYPVTTNVRLHRFNLGVGILLN